MRRGPFFLCSLLFAVVAPMPAHASGPILVSDVDDTIKIANVPHKFPAAVVNGLFGERIFAGMSELYRAVGRTPDSMVFLSGGPNFLAHHVREEIDEGGFPPYRLLLRDVLKKGNTIAVHKRARLEEILAADPAASFVLVGDDGEADPEILAGFAKAHPGKAVVYIHRVLGRMLPAGLIGYATAFELALAEFRAGRIGARDAAEVGEAVLDAKAAFVFPGFTVCPKAIDYPTSPEIAASAELSDLIAKNRARWSAYCAKRGD